MNAEKRQKLEEMKAICYPPEKLERLCACEMYVYKPISFVFTRLFIKTNVTPNQLTWFWGLLLVFASLLFLIDCPWLWVLASALWILCLALDFTDGDIARCKKLFSKRGEFLDMVIHSITFPMSFICIGLGVYYQHGNVITVVLGAIAGLSMVLIMYLPRLHNLIDPENTIQGLGRSQSVEGKFFKDLRTYKRVVSCNPITFLNVYIILFVLTIINVFFTSKIDVFGWFEISLLGAFLLFYGVSYLAATLVRIAILYRKLT